MKKFICAILTSALLLTSVLPAMAKDVDVKEHEIDAIVTEFCNNMPSDPSVRVRVWSIFKAYMLDGNNGIDTLISVLKGEGTLPAGDDMQRVFRDFVNSVKDTYADQFIFLLEVYKNTPMDARRISLNNFGSTPSNPGDEIVKTPLALTTAEKTAADAIFDAYVTADAMSKLNVHDIDSANFLNLITPFKGLFKMTEDDGDLVLAEYDEDFAESLAEDLADYTEINGVDIDGDTDAENGFLILKGIAKMFNSFSSQIDNMKVVLANGNIALYEDGLDKATNPADDDEDSGYNSPSSPSSTSRRDNNSSKGFTLGTPVYNTARNLFSDVDASSWAVPYIMNLFERKIFTGYEDGTFMPDVGITRQEIAVVLVRAMGLEADAKVAANNATGFSDEDKIADWARGYVNIAVHNNLFTGYDDNEFKPDRTVSRQELTTVIMRLCNDTTTSTAMNYTDVNEIQDYAKAYVGKATNLGIVSGYPDGTFRPANNVTRAEAAKIIYNGVEYYKYLAK